VVTCVRGLVLAVLSLAGLLLFAASVLSPLSLAAGMGILLAPMSLLAVRGLASTQRRWARLWSGVTIATPYRPRPVEITNGLIGRLQRCKWLLTDPANWRNLLWVLAGVPVGVVLGLLPAFMVAAAVWTLVADGGAVLFGWWKTAPPNFWGQVFFLGMLPLVVVTGPLLLRAHAWAAASLLARPGRRWPRSWAS
jgi:Putative sensor